MEQSLEAREEAQTRACEAVTELQRVRAPPPPPTHTDIHAPHHMCTRQYARSAPYVYAPVRTPRTICVHADAHAPHHMYAPVRTLCTICTRRCARSARARGGEVTYAVTRGGAVRCRCWCRCRCVAVSGCGGLRPSGQSWMPNATRW
jgi:hypothetical protein